MATAPAVHRPAELVDATARRLFDADKSAAPETRTTGARSVAATHATVHTDGGDGPDDALHYLEAEWSMRMEAPLSALASLEETVSRQIAKARAALPPLER